MATLMSSSQMLLENTSTWEIYNSTLQDAGGHQFSESSKLALAIVISIVTVFGLIGNTMVIFIVLYFPDMYNVFSFAFANLALTDLTMLLLDAIPTAADTFGLNFSKHLGCGVSLYLQYVVAEVTSLTLAFLSWDRYRLIVKPVETRRTRTSRQIYITMAIIWIISFVVQIPTAFVPRVQSDIGCNEFGLPRGEQLFFTYATVTLYIIPLLIMIPCYTSIAQNLAKLDNLQKRKRTIFWIFVLVIFYAIMWLPIHVVHMWQAFSSVVDAKTPLYIELHTAANVLMFFNSSTNPYLYPMAVPAFRKHLKEIAHFCTCGLLTTKGKAIQCSGLPRRSDIKMASVET